MCACDPVLLHYVLLIREGFSAVKLGVSKDEKEQCAFVAMPGSW